MIPNDGSAALMQTARLGTSLEVARETELYRFLTACADAAAQEAVESLLGVDPGEVGLVARYQSQAEAYRALARWVDDAIERGHAAQGDLARQTYVD